MALATVSEIQTILRMGFSTETTYITAMLPVIEDTIKKYFNTDFSGDIPVGLKRPTAILIKQMMENPGAVLVQTIGDDEVRYGKIDLSVIFSGFEDIIVGGSNSGYFLNLKDINTDLGL